MYEYGKRWVEAGHQVTVVTAPYEKSDIRTNKFFDTIEVDGIRVRIINASDSNRYSTTWRVIKAFQFAFFSSVYALTLRYDVIICSSGPITVGVPGLLAHWLRRKKLIFEVRDLWPAGGIEMKKIRTKGLIKLALWFESQCYYAASGVVTASVGQLAHIRDRFPGLCLEVIPNASDINLFGFQQQVSLPYWSAGKKIYTHTGSLGFIHNVGLLIRAMHEIQKQGRTDVILVLIGDGAERAELEVMADSMKDNLVFFLGLLPKTALPSWIQQSVATVFTTLNNPVQNTSSPNKVFDSFAAGTPVIQTTTGWLYDLFEKEQCGLNVPPDDPKALADAILRLAGNEMLRAELSYNAKRIANTQFNRELLASRYLSLLQTVHDR